MTAPETEPPWTDYIPQVMETLAETYHGKGAV